MKISNSVHVKVSSGENVCVIPFISSGFWSQFVSLRSISSSFHFHDFFVPFPLASIIISNSVFAGGLHFCSLFSGSNSIHQRNRFYRSSCWTQKIKMVYIEQLYHFHISGELHWAQIRRICGKESPTQHTTEAPAAPCV